MAEKGVIWGQTAAKQIAKTVREVARRTVNEQSQRGRWQQKQNTYPVWAVNIGSLAAATHPLTGHSTGVAGLLANSGDDLVTTDARRSFIRRDTGGGTIADGTLIQLDIVSGKLSIVWADCDSHADLEGLEAVPE